MKNTKLEEHWVLIANPVSGRGQKKHLAHQVAQHIRQDRSAPELLWTDGRGHAEELAGKAVRDGATHIVVLGGDGTIHEVVNGIMNSRISVESVILGIIPLGSGNDLARELKIPRKLSLAIQTLLSGNVHLIDLGKVGERYFVTVATIGFDTAVSRYVLSGAVPGLFRGTMKYLYGALATLFRYHSVQVRFRGDIDEFEGPVFLAAIANTSTYGGGMRISPSAMIDDGNLTLCLVRQISNLEALKVFPGVFSGQHVKHHSVSMHLFRKLEVSSNDPLDIWADGEPAARTPALFQVVPYALPVLVT